MKLNMEDALVREIDLDGMTRPCSDAQDFIDEMAEKLLLLSVALRVVYGQKQADIVENWAKRAAELRSKGER